ncbi:LTA synthase family protein [Paenibacillus sp. V4I7]|uniref:LTA synthase family protein n=1 Tax=Paenibacillus sp. V4I7 TaxID=3042307 RepID=UPI00278342EB|nr:LTA synthase family protein [Paenibacillus sp. V4I7]MDQ0903924.1 lipoteichoic acid synthase [Paenibacillus sp. V4I7]
MKHIDIRKIINFFFMKGDVLLFVMIITTKLYLFNHFASLPLTSKAIILSICGVLLVCSLLNMLDNKYRLISLYLLNVFFSLILLLDLIYLHYFEDVTSLSLFSQVGQLGELGGSIKNLYQAKYTVLLFDLFIELILILRFSRLIENFYANRYKPNIKINALLSLIIIIFCGAMFGMKVYNLEKRGEMLLKSRISNLALVDAFGIYSYHAIDIYSYLETNIINKPKVTQKDIASINEWFHNNKKNQSNNSLFGVDKGKNVILIQEESLQEFVVNFSYKGQEITPNLNNLIKDSAYFNRFYDQTSQGRTSDAEFTALNSLYTSPYSGSVNFHFPKNDFDTLVKRLNNQNYSSLSAHPFRGSFWNRAPMHKSYGFQKSLFEKDFDLKSGDLIGWGLSDRSFLLQSSQYLEQLPKPFFSFLITLTNHHPYDHIPLIEQELSLGELNETLVGNYLHSVHFADKALGQFIEKLKKDGLYDTSIIALYGDHDSGIPDSELAKIGLKPKNTRYYDKVPFLIHSSKLSKENLESFTSQVAGHLDITPTLLYLLGISTEDSHFMGDNLFDTNSKKIVVFRDNSFITNTSFFITNKNFDSGTCYDKENNVIDTMKCEPNFIQAKKRLEISDLILKTNLLTQLDNK